MPGRGRPRKYADAKEANRSRVQQYRERQRHPPLQTPPPSQFQNIFLAWDPRQQLDTAPPPVDSLDVFADLRDALDAVPLHREETGQEGNTGESDSEYELDLVNDEEGGLPPVDSEDDGTFIYSPS
jgi:hypothetical protein